MKCTCKIDDVTKLDFYNLPDCPMAWDLIKSGKTKGLFQIESYLGKKWSKRLSPDSIELLSALVAVVRPGVIKAKNEEGESLTEVFCKCRHKEIEPTSIDKHIDHILAKTFQIPVYQEQVMAIAQELGGFDLKEADQLRKAMGRKDAELMAQSRNLFVEKSVEKGLIDRAKAEAIFDILEKSNRYNFNQAHAVAYAQLAYITGYLKSHYPLEFFAAWIKHANNEQDPQQEIKELVNDAREFGVEVLPPRLCDLKANTYISNGKVYLGLSNIKGIADKKVATWAGFKLAGMNWHQIMCSGLFTPKTLSVLISAGALSYLGSGRARMLAELNAWEQLTKLEQNLIPKYGSTFVTMLSNAAKLKKDGGVCHTQDRVNTLQFLLKSLINSPYAIKDTAYTISKQEIEYLGVALTCVKSDSANKGVANCTIADIPSRKYKSKFVAELVEVKICRVKNGVNKGKEMAFCVAQDDSGTINIVIFANKYEEVFQLVLRGNVVLIEGYQKDESFLVQEIWQV